MPLVLQIQPVPKNNWGDNLAHTLPKEVWDTLRREVYDRAGYRCEFCGETMVELHCHEDWGYDDRLHIQTLQELICICKRCHDCIHWFRTENQVLKGKGQVDGYRLGYLGELKDHFTRVNHWTYSRFNYYIRKASYLRDLRLRYDYTIVYGKWDPKRISRLYGSR